MDSRYRFLTLGTPWTQSMPSRDVNAVTRLAEASWRRDNVLKYIRSAFTVSQKLEKSLVTWRNMTEIVRYSQLSFFACHHARKEFWVNLEWRCWYM